VQIGEVLGTSFSRVLFFNEGLKLLIYS
jgi:hypothetical protein